MGSRSASALPSSRWDEADLVTTLRSVAAHRVVVVAAGTVLAPHYVAEVRRLVDAAPGCVVTLAGAEGAVTGPPLEIATFELFGGLPAGRVVPAAYALPVSALVDGGLGALGPDPVVLTTTVARCVMWCGRVDSSRVALAVAPGSGSELGDVLDAVVAGLDGEPSIHGAGGLAPTLAVARELERQRDAHETADADLQELRVRHDGLARARDAEVAELHARIARQSTPWGALSFAASRWSSALVRRLRRKAPMEDQP